MLLKQIRRRGALGLALASTLLLGAPLVALAQGNPGLTIFSGVKREDNLSFFLDFGGKRGSFDRYRLYIPSKKMKLAVNQINISYPDYYRGKFNADEIEVFVKGKKVPVQEAKWLKDDYLIQIALAEPIPAGESVEIHLSDVKNPSFGGMFYFRCTVMSPGDVPLPRYIGTWIIDIS